MSVLTEEEIFAAAVQKPPTERASFLDRACAGEALLRSQVESLLRAHDGPDSLLDAPGNCATIAAAPSIKEALGTQIGPYKLLEQIGEGGMGLVYMAEQQQPVKRLVALKLVKPGMDTKQVIARFEAERQALAMMDHPNIAKVHDAGTTETGRPYFVMELVRGIPISEFCDQQKLTVRQRLELLIQVCQAIQHAHQKGIIHRDLKPTNVLVTKADSIPLPKVIDFGIAKALGPSLTDHTLHTGFAQLVGTPMYMSPEQAEMNHFGVDTRSDVYSLGVLLYELLTGTTPFDKETLSKAGLDEVRRMIREDDPPRPSARISTLNAQVLSTISQQRNIEPRNITAALRGELDWIVMKALEKDRTRRYESASALAADIQRYLSDEPVLACPPTAMYRFQKFARKHRAALTTAAAIAVCLILGTTVSAWQAMRATTAEGQAREAATGEAEQRQRAEANEQKAVANEQKAVANAAAAEQKEQEAIRQRDDVKALAEQLAAKERQLQRTLYAAHMNLAHNAWHTSAIGGVLGMLEDHRPKQGEPDLRGFEWYYLQRLCHGELLTFSRHNAAVLGVAFSPDGKRLFSGGGEGRLILWDAETGQVIRNLQHDLAWVRSVAYSPDGQRLASFSDRKLKVWDAQTGQELLSFACGNSNLYCTVVFSPDGKRLAAMGDAGKARIWDAQTGQELLTLGPSWGNVVFSPDGKHVVSSNGYQINMWDAATGQEFRTIKRMAGVIAFTPDGKRLASGLRTYGNSAGMRGDVTISDAETGQELLSLKGSERQGVSALVFSPDGKLLAGGSADGNIRVWDAKSGEHVATLKGHTNWVDTIAYSPDGARLASASRDGTVKVWPAQELTSKEGKTLKGGADREGVWAVAFSPDGQRVASAHMRSDEIRVWDAQTGKDLLSLSDHDDSVWSVAFSPDGKRLASASYDKTVKVWDADTGKNLLTLSGHTDEVLGVAYSPDGKRLASASYDDTVRLWDAQTGQPIHVLKSVPHTPNRPVWPTGVVAFSPGGERLASGCEGQLKVWNAETGQELLTLKGRREETTSVAFSPDGKHIASGQGEIMLWDLETGKEIRTLRGHASRVPGLVYSPDGKRLASASSDGTVKLWDPQTGEATLTFTAHTGAVCHLAFSPDGHRLLSNGPDGVVKVWDATPLPAQPRAGLKTSRIDPSTLPGLVIDDDAAEKQGAWKLSTAMSRSVGDGFLHDGNRQKGQSSATYKFVVNQPGRYDVRIAYPAYANHATNVPIVIEHIGGRAEVKLNQRIDPKIDEIFHSIGQFPFDKGAVITISNADTDGVVVIDAVQLVPATGAVDVGNQ